MKGFASVTENDWFALLSQQLLLPKTVRQNNGGQAYRRRASPPETWRINLEQKWVNIIWDQVLNREFPHPCEPSIFLLQKKSPPTKAPWQYTNQLPAVLKTDAGISGYQRILRKVGRQLVNKLLFLVKGAPIKGRVKSSPDNVSYFLSQNYDRSYINWPFRYVSLVDPAASTMISLLAEKANL